jgi:hypothetical protein
MNGAIMDGFMVVGGGNVSAQRVDTGGFGSLQANAAHQAGVDEERSGGRVGF